MLSLTVTVSPLFTNKTGSEETGVAVAASTPTSTDVLAVSAAASTTVCDSVRTAIRIIAKNFLIRMFYTS